ncbi:MAG: 3-phosphoshikimate 1-carboxyvinyltransferase [Candidatus Fervidibacter sp.]|uniref:3-phosphoshikimate 1-carboxyvinyltransferase n=1 Tax=Candidatus Fervidibacter sp. TaxID=3100871 RepID=UPI00404ADE84
MKLLVRGMAKLQGAFSVPGDKSISHRALLLGAIASGKTEVENCLVAEDVISTARCLQQLGVRIDGVGTTSLVVHGAGGANLQKTDEPLDCGNSGTTIRLLMGILAAHRFESLLTGDASLQKRPMDRVATPLQRMGAKVEGRTERYLPPIRIQGVKLKPIEWALPVASAQAKSAILLAGLFAEGTTLVHEPAPSRDHTERMLRSFGAKVIVKELSVAVIGPARLKGTKIVIPGDPSSAAFFLCAAAALPGSEVTAIGISVNPTRSGYLDILKRMCAEVTAHNERIQGGEPIADVTVRSSKLKGTTIAGELIPSAIDELPVLAAIATVAEGTTVIRNAQELRVKESDRIATMVSELKKLGVKVEELSDGMVIHGGSKLVGAEVDSHGDHRVAMALTVAGLLAEGETVIHNSDCISISFPQFPQVLASLGAEVELK